MRVDQIEVHDGEPELPYEVIREVHARSRCFSPASHSTAKASTTTASTATTFTRPSLVRRGHLGEGANYARPALERTLTAAGSFEAVWALSAPSAPSEFCGVVRASYVDERLRSLGYWGCWEPPPLAKKPLIE